MNKPIVFILTVVATLISALVLTLPWSGFGELITLGEAYFGGIGIGGLLVVLWIMIKYVWKD